MRRKSRYRPTMEGGTGGRGVERGPMRRKSQERPTKGEG